MLNDFFGSVILARYAVLPYGYSLPPTTSSGFLSHSPMATYNTLCQCTDLTIGLRRTWYNGCTRRLDLITFRWPYLLPHCGFPFSASQLGKSYVRKKAMQWICRRFTPPSSTALLFPGPSYTDTYIDTTSTTLAGGCSSRVS